MSNFERFWTRTSRLHDEESQLLLSEGLVQTYPPHALINSLYRLYPNFPRRQVTIEPKNVVVIQYRSDISIDPNFQQLLMVCGYVNTRTDHKSGLFVITLEPKFPGEVPDQMVPAHVFHVSLSTSRAKIQKIGITPKTSRTTFNHPGNRIYLLATSSPAADVLKMVNMLKRNRNHQNVMYDVYCVDTVRDYTYYYDPSFQLGDMSSTSYAIFSLRNITPDQIKLIGSV